MRRDRCGAVKVIYRLQQLRFVIDIALQIALILRNLDRRANDID